MLQTIKPYKKEYDYSYTLGVFLTIELLENKPEQVQCVVLSSLAHKNTGVDKIENICAARNISCYINDKVLTRISPKENCYAAGIFNKYESALSKDKNHVVLVNPMDSGNLGTIMRTCLGFQVQDLAIIRPAVDIFDPKTVRASMGALFGMNFKYYDSFEAYNESFQAHYSYPFILKGRETVYNLEKTKKEPCALIFGNESSGLPESFEHVGTGIVIPHSRQIDSLNLSIAVGIALYELCKFNK